MSTIFDPLRWPAPLTVIWKIMYQGLWTLNLAWDDPLPPENGASMGIWWDRPTFLSNMNQTQVQGKMKPNKLPRYHHQDNNPVARQNKLEVLTPAHLLIGENYEKAWDLLKERYDNKRLLAASFFSASLELAPIQRATAANIRTFHDITKEMLHNVQNLQLENPFDSLITHLLMKKLDHDTREPYESQLAYPREVPRLEDCLNFLLRRFQSLETSESYKSSNIRTLKPEVNIPRKVFVSTENHEPREIDSRFIAIKQPRVATPPPGVAQICHYCNGHGHLIIHCMHFSQITPKARSCFINRHKLCTNCLTHGSRTECNEKPSCTKCSDKHHSQLHEPT